MARLNTIFLVAALALTGCGVTDVTTGNGDGNGDANGDGDPTDGGSSDPSSDASTDGFIEEPSTDPTYPSAHPRIYVTANRGRLEAALAANTAAASTFKAKVDAWVGGSDIWGFRAWNSALVGQLTGDAIYCTTAVASVEAQVLGAEAAIATGRNPAVSLDSYLEIGELIGDLALVYDWCSESLSEGQKQRWIAYANQAVWNVWHHEDATWGGRAAPWSGWSVTNPSNNYYYSFLRATMLLGLATKGENPQADEWIHQFRDVKILGELVPTFESDLEGGASREGTGYGVAMRRLFELYDLWYGTTGERLAGKTSHTRKSMHAFLHQVLPTLDKVAPTGDHARDSTATFFDYHRDYLLELMRLYPTDPVAARAKTLLAESNVPAMSSGFMAANDFLYEASDIIAAPLGGNTAYHAPGIGQIYARSGWEKGATWMNLTGGPYTESHAHQDQGALMLFKGGWLIHDANVHSRSGLSQAATSHSLVRIDQGGTPVKQIANTESHVVGLAQGEGYVYAAVDVTPAYNGHAAVQKVQRETIFLPPNIVIVYDRVVTAAGTTQTWQAQTPVPPAVGGAGATITNGGHTLAITKVVGGSLSTTDMRGDADLQGGYRLDEQQAGGDQRYLHVLSIDGAATAVVGAGDTGVTVNLAGGGSATVTFSRDDVGATLVLNGASIALDDTVATLDP